MITAELVGGAALAARLAAMPGRVEDGLARAVERLGQQLRDRIRDDKLGGAVLQRRSGRLAASIDVAIERSGASVTARLATELPYAAIHEYGGTLPAREIVPRGARALAFPWKGRLRFFKRVEIPEVAMPQRSFLRSALAEMAPEIRDGLAEAVRAAARLA